MPKKEVSIIGGDLRQLSVAKFFEASNFDVKIFGWNDEMSAGFLQHKSVIEASASDILIFPMPMCVGSKVNAPYSDTDIELEDILSNISSKTIVLGGKIPESIKDRLRKRKIMYADYLNREELAIKNAVATAEGALEIAMRELPITIHSSRCIVTGYGRIGKILARMLKNLGAFVTVAARRIEVRAEAEADGFKTDDTKNLHLISKGQDLIFNTAPALLFDEAVLSCVDKGTLLVDLASKPGGVDFENAKKTGVNVIWALSLPGKVAPVTSGKIIYEAVCNILNELEV